VVMLISIDLKTITPPQPFYALRVPLEGEGACFSTEITVVARIDMYMVSLTKCHSALEAGGFAAFRPPLPLTAPRPVATPIHPWTLPTSDET